MSSFSQLEHVPPQDLAHNPLEPTERLEGDVNGPVSETAFHLDSATTKAEKVERSADDAAAEDGRPYKRVKVDQGEPSVPPLHEERRRGFAAIKPELVCGTQRIASQKTYQFPGISFIRPVMMSPMSSLETCMIHDDPICATTMQRRESRIGKAKKAKRKDRTPAGTLAALEMH